MSLLGRVDLPALQEALQVLELDGWLLYDFRGINPIVRRIVGIEGMATRRLFVWLPAKGHPVAVAHRIELQGLDGFPGTVVPYAEWGQLHESVQTLVSGKKVAMEVSPFDAVPYLDWVPGGVVSLIQKLGGTIASSAPLVSQFAARLTPEEIAGHTESAEIIADIARSTLRDVVQEVGMAREAAVQRRVAEAIERGGLTSSHPPIVAFGANAANPHYEPREGLDALLAADQVVLLDLWGGKGKRSVYADQTWMGFAGSAPPDRVAEVWTAVRDARDAVVERLRVETAAQKIVTGAQLDDVARAVIREHGFADAFVHRTGHSIDVELHGSGPHLDNFETNDTRPIIPGMAFSVEPGVYLANDFGVRSEINVVLFADRPRPTPRAPQVDLITSV